MSLVLGQTLLTALMVFAAWRIMERRAAAESIERQESRRREWDAATADDERGF